MALSRHNSLCCPRVEAAVELECFSNPQLPTRKCASFSYHETCCQVNGACAVCLTMHFANVIASNDLQHLLSGARNTIHSDLFRTQSYKCIDNIKSRILDHHRAIHRSGSLHNSGSRSTNRLGSRTLGKGLSQEANLRSSRRNWHWPGSRHRLLAISPCWPSPVDRSVAAHPSSRRREA